MNHDKCPEPKSLGPYEVGLGAEDEDRDPGQPEIHLTKAMLVKLGWTEKREKPNENQIADA